MWIAVALAVALVPWASHAQISRVATTTAALRASPVFFHGKQVAVLGTTTPMRDVIRLDDPGATPDATAAAAAPPQSAGRGIYVYFRERPTRSNGELRGEFWDLGRLTEGDTRFSAYDFRPLLEAVTQGRWPGRDQVFVILGANLIDEHLPTTPTLRSIALAPERYENKGVTVSGRFRGRNLFGDLAGPLSSPSKYDFVVQSADAALWVTGIRPRGKGFELDPGARVDTGRWIQVEGTVRRDASRSWIEAREIELTSAPQETAATPVEVEVPITPPEPPPTVVFSSPVADEPDVETTTVVRVQFSRDMDSRSFKDRIRVGYVTPPQATNRGPAPPTFSFAYNVGSRGVEVKFASPLERFQTVRVDLLEGIKTIDGDAFQPWTLTFITGGR